MIILSNIARAGFDSGQGTIKKIEDFIYPRATWILTPRSEQLIVGLQGKEYLKEFKKNILGSNINPVSATLNEIKKSAVSTINNIAPYGVIASITIIFIILLFLKIKG